MKNVARDGRQSAESEPFSRPHVQPVLKFEDRNELQYVIPGFGAHRCMETTYSSLKKVFHQRHACNHT
jgi:hypothetical protein